MLQLTVSVNKLNKRSAIPASLPDSATIVDVVSSGITFQGELVPYDPSQPPGGWYVDREGYYYWGGGLAVENIEVVATDSMVKQATILGVDVSSYQSRAISWPSVKKSITFAYIKATEGILTIDALCNTHATGAKAAGLKIGYYHFALSTKDAVEQAQHFDTAVKNMPAADLLPVLDIETNKGNLSATQMESWINSYINTLNILGHPQVMIYSYYSFLYQNLSPLHQLGKYPLWIAEYNNLPAPNLPKGWSNFTVWQYSEAGQVEGMLDNVDMNKATADFYIK